MNRNSESQNGGPPESEGNENLPAVKGFHAGNVVRIALPAAVLLIAAVAFFGLFDGAQLLTKWTSPKLVKVTGRVLFNGEPLANAEVATQSVAGGGTGAFGATDEKGQFTLLTHVNGEFVTGVTAGEHHVTVIRRHNITTLGLPPLMTPERFASFATSPLRIVASEGSNVELKLDGVLSDPPPARPPMVQRPPGDRGDAQKKSNQADEEASNEKPPESKETP